MKYSVSVLIPVYNRKFPLVRALNSVLNQTYLPDEIIVADDASDFFVADYLQNEHPEIASKVKVVRCSENRGVSGARNLAFSHSSGNIIAFLDSDDCWDPKKLAEQIKVFEEDPTIDLVSCKQWIIKGNTKKDQAKNFYSKNLFDHLTSDWHPPNPSTLVLRREHMETIPFDETIRYLEDLDWWLRFSLLEPNIRCIDKPLMFYYINEENRLSYTLFHERFKKIEHILLQWKQRVIKYRGLDQYNRFRRYLLTYNAIDAFVVYSRKRDIILVTKIVFGYLWNKREFYQLLRSKTVSMMKE